MTRTCTLAAATVILIAPSIASAGDASAPGYSLLTVDQAAGFCGAVPSMPWCSDWEPDLTCAGVNFTCGDFLSPSTCTGYTMFTNNMLGRCIEAGDGECWVIDPNVDCYTNWLCEWNYIDGVCRHPWWDLGATYLRNDERCSVHAIP
jgi:hypothetical protein